jgi:hypothetical protein
MPPPPSPASGSTPPPASATLIIGITYPFPDASLSISADDEVLYSHALQAETKKRFGLFQTVQGHESATVRVRSGQHQLHVHVHSSAPAYDDLKTISSTFARQDTKTLEISFHGHQKDMRLDLR